MEGNNGAIWGRQREEEKKKIQSKVKKYKRIRWYANEDNVFVKDDKRNEKSLSPKQHNLFLFCFSFIQQKENERKEITQKKCLSVKLFSIFSIFFRVEYCGSWYALPLLIALIHINKPYKCKVRNNDNVKWYFWKL